MASNRVKCLLAENKRLQSLVGKLAGTIQTIHLQIEQKEDALAKRRNRCLRRTQGGRWRICREAQRRSCWQRSSIEQCFERDRRRDRQTTLAERDRRDQERSRRIQRKRDEDIERDRQDYENTIRKMAEMEERDKLKMERNKLMLEQKFAKLDEDLRLHLRRIHLRHVVIRRQRTGEADAA